MKTIKTLFLALFASVALSTSAQAPLADGGNQLNFGLGFGWGLPVYASYDFSVHPDITVAPEISFNLDGMDYLIIAGRGDYHFNTLLSIPSNFDFYAGANLGFAVGFNGGSSDLDLGAQVGGRWYWNEKWGLNLEFAGGMIGAGGKIGVSMKL